MKRIYKYSVVYAGLLSLFLMPACQKMSDLRIDPNVSSTGTPKMLLTGMELDLIDGPNSSTNGFSKGTDALSDGYNGPWNYTQRCNQYYVLGQGYYGTQDYSWSSGVWFYSSMRNTVQLDEEADKTGGGDIVSAYHAIAKFMRTLYYFEMTEQMGDIPMSDALKGTSDNVYYPKYDAQKDVLVQCFKWLSEANDSLAAIISRNPTVKVDGDIFYNGDLHQWQQAVNSCWLRELINQTNKADDPDLKIKPQIAQILGNTTAYPMILQDADNLQISFNGSDVTNNYILYPLAVAQLFTNRDVLASTYVDLMTSLKDPRLLIIGVPAPAITPDPNNPYANYKGANTGDLQDNIYAGINQGLYSTINLNYWVTGAAGIPCVQLGAYETDFNVAEAINRGWATGDVAQYYEDGIRRSMEFYGVADNDISAYLAQSAVQYKGNNADGLKQILLQKYIAFFNNSGWQAYFNYRRTGVPTFSIGPSNQNGGKIPVRFTYPQSEYQNNKDNVQAAIQSQFNGSDTRNDVMWMLK